MHVRRVAYAIHRVEALGHRHRLVDLAVGSMQLFDAGRYQLAFGVVPGTFSDSISSIRRGLSAHRGRTQIRAPGVVPGAFSFCKRLAVRIGPGQPTQIAAFAASTARDEEG